MRSIELHLFESCCPVLVNTKKISTIYEDPHEECVIISFAGDEDDYIIVKESYEDVKRALLEAESND